MKRAYKYRLYPTIEHADLLAKTFGCVRFAYNSILQWRTKAFRDKQEKISYTQASARLTELKKEPALAWLNEVSCVPLQQSLRHQQTAFKNFFEGRSAYPAFKSKRNKQAAEFTARAFKYVDGKLYIAKSPTPLNVRWSRSLPSIPSRVTIIKDLAGRYFVSCLCEFEPTPLPISMTTVGIEVGLNDVFAPLGSSRIPPHQHMEKYEKRLASLQQHIGRKVKGSKNRAKVRLKIARLRAKIADCRMDKMHKLSRILINENQVVCVGSLTIKKSKCPSMQSWAITDVCRSELLHQLQYKAEWAGRSVVFKSSAEHSCDSFSAISMSFDVYHGMCTECSSRHDCNIHTVHDTNAAGLAVSAHGAVVKLNILKD